MEKQQENRGVIYDHALEIEVYRLGGVAQTFPNHFHNDYVIGLMEQGARSLRCQNREYELHAGDLLLLNPRDSHYCVSRDGGAFDYRAINIRPERMARAATELTGGTLAPHFSQNVVPQSPLKETFCALCDAIERRAPPLEREEAFYFFMEPLLRAYSQAVAEVAALPVDERVASLCAYMEAHFEKQITLDKLAAMSGLGKSYLLRSFTRQMGVSPYRYLQTVRLEHAKRLLEQGYSPVEAAYMTGFSDQSHFTNQFRTFIGLTPGQYQRIFTSTMEDEPHGDDNHV